MPHCRYLPCTYGLAVLGLFSLAACTHSTAPWHEISGQGLPWQGFLSTALHFTTDSTGLLLGLEEAGYPSAAQAFRPVVYRTPDGGHSWTRASFGPDGSFWAIAQGGPVVYAALAPTTPEPGPTPCVVLRSADNGRHWQDGGTLPDLAVELAFADSATGVALLNDDQTGLARQQLYRTTDGGRHWRPYFLARDYVHQLRYTPTAELWLLLGSDARGQATQLMRVGGSAHKPLTELLPDSVQYWGNLASDDAGNLWLTGRRGAALQLWRRDARNGRYTLVRQFSKPDASPLLAHGLQVAGRSISLLAATSDTSAGLNRHYFYHSASLGRTWEEEPLPTVTAATPVAFHGPERVWIHTLGPGFQVR